MLRSVAKLFNWLLKAKKAVSVLMLISMLLITFTQVVFRYVFNNSLTWAEETTLLILVWYSYLVMACELREAGHVSLAGLYNHSPNWLKRVLDIIHHTMLCGFFAIMTYYGVVQTKLTLPKLFSTIPISVGLLYLPQVIGGAFMTVYSLAAIWNACKKNYKIPGGEQL